MKEKKSEKANKLISLYITISGFSLYAVTKAKFSQHQIYTTETMMMRYNNN